MRNVFERLFDICRSGDEAEYPYVLPVTIG